MTGTRELLGRLSFALFLVLAPFALGDCLNAGGPSFVTLGVSVEPAPLMLGGLGGSGALPEKIADICVRLPVLLGSSVEKTTSVANGLGVTVNATRDGAKVTFPGADAGSSARSYELAKIRSGVKETIALSVDGEGYMATIESGCTNP